MDQRRFAAQKPLLVGIQDRDQPTFWNIETLTQQVDAYQHVIYAASKVTDQFNTLQRFDIAVHVPHPKPGLVHELGQILRHAFGQRGDKRAETSLGRFTAFVDAILHLIFNRLNFDRWINEASRANNLLGKYAAGLLHLPSARCRGNAHGLRAHNVPFVKAQRPVVYARG